ncbi:MAG: tetraacyldisaccharide 4'-kinase, partial [Burkholderiales bacterium]|nr:tetraacyldisaccharide 4'-kinase [Burkholderiales bacterium]
MMALAGRIETLLARHWWRARPSWFSRCLLPLSWLYDALRHLAAARSPLRAPVPVVVVGNLIAGG